MADEITVSTGLTLINARNKIRRDTQSVRFDQTGNNFYGPYKEDLTGSYVSATKGDVGTVGKVYLENPEADGGENAVVSLDNGVTDMLSLEPGEANTITMVGGYDITKMQFKAASSASSIIVTILEA